MYNVSVIKKFRLFCLVHLNQKNDHLLSGVHLRYIHICLVTSSPESLGIILIQTMKNYFVCIPVYIIIIPRKGHHQRL